MNIHQFKYILALAETRHFENAAERCHITQSTLSTMISKFEDELGILVFDRRKKPVEITAEGLKLIEQLKRIDKEIGQLEEISQEIKGDLKGELSISVIPTVAPTLLPLFLSSFAEKFPRLQIQVKEQTTAEIVRQIKSRELDIGLVSIPLNEKDIKEYPLYDEPFVFYDKQHIGSKKIDAKSLNLDNLCLLEDGHCLRSQVLELCDIHHKLSDIESNVVYNAGSIDSLMRYVKANRASTLLPLLSTHDMPKEDRSHLLDFNEPIPYRTVGIIVHQHFVRNKVLKLLSEEIKEKVGNILPALQLQGKQLNPV
jgi:LysR family hydrogen peroxide-inducible transcriptional activator